MTRVVMLDGGTLLGTGLVSILAEDKTLQVERIPDRDMPTLLHMLEERQPDVIVLTEESPLDATRLLDLLSVIRTNERLRIIHIHYDDTLDLYDKRQVTISHSRDVFQLIHSQQFSQCAAQDGKSALATENVQRAVLLRGEGTLF